MNYKVPNWFPRWQRQQTPSRPSTKIRISFTSRTRIFSFEKKKKEKINKIITREVTHRRGRSPFLVFALPGSNVRFVGFRGRGTHVLLWSTQSSVTRLRRARFPSANLQSHANPRKIIFQLTLIVPECLCRDKTRLVFLLINPLSSIWC